MAKASNKKTGWGTSRNLAGAELMEFMEQKLAEGAIHPDAIRIPAWPKPAEHAEVLGSELERRKQLAAKRLLEFQESLESVPEDEREPKLAEFSKSEESNNFLRRQDQILETWPVSAPYAYSQIIRRKSNGELYYHLIEPELTDHERRIMAFARHTIIDVLDQHPDKLDIEGLTKHLEGAFQQVLSDYGLTLGDDWVPEEESRGRLLYFLNRDFIGEGFIDALLKDPNIEDISCDGPHVPLFVYHRKYEGLETNLRLSDTDKLDRFVIRMGQRSGRHVSIAEPILDSTLPDGSRLQATLGQEVSSFGATFTIRRFREEPFSPIDLMKFGTMNSQMLSFWWMIMDAHFSGLYAGGTASGKTTALNAILSFVPPRNKVVTIEDTRELRIPEPNWISAVTRSGFGAPDSNGRQAGHIDMFQLLRNALRQRPEFIIVGEVRGAEAYNLFQAMATGHAAFGTMHADSIDAVIHRLESEPMNVPRNLLEALDLVAVQAQTRVGGKRVRRTKSMTEIVGMDPNTNEILTNEVFRWDPATDTFIMANVSFLLQKIATESGRSLAEVNEEVAERAEFLENLAKTGVIDYVDVCKQIRAYGGRQ